MKDFPDFMKSLKNRIPVPAQNTKDVEGYFYEGADGGQMAFWTCYEDRTSQPAYSRVRRIHGMRKRAVYGAHRRAGDCFNPG